MMLMVLLGCRDATGDMGTQVNMRDIRSVPEDSTQCEVGIQTDCSDPSEAILHFRELLHAIDACHDGVSQLLDIDAEVIDSEVVDISDAECSFNRDLPCPGLKTTDKFDMDCNFEIITQAYAIEHEAKQTTGHFRTGEVGWEVVLVGNILKCLIHGAGAGRQVVWFGAAKLNGHNDALALS